MWHSRTWAFWKKGHAVNKTVANRKTTKIGKRADRIGDGQEKVNKSPYHRQTK